MNSKEQLSCINCLHKLVSHVVWWGGSWPTEKGAGWCYVSHCNSCLNLSNGKEYKNILMHRSVYFTLLKLTVAFQSYCAVNALMKYPCTSMFNWYLAVDKCLACSGFHCDPRKEEKFRGESCTGDVHFFDNEVLWLLKHHYAKITKIC